MATKVTRKQLENLVATLNVKLNRPADSYFKDTWGAWQGCEGHIKLDFNSFYGGYMLNVMTSGTGETNFQGLAQRLSAREMYYYLTGVLAGIAESK